jgi:hypothetical protein
LLHDVRRAQLKLSYYLDCFTIHLLAGLDSVHGVDYAQGKGRPGDSLRLKIIRLGLVGLLSIIRIISLITVIWVIWLIRTVMVVSIIRAIRAAQGVYFALLSILLLSFPTSCSLCAIFHVCRFINRNTRSMPHTRLSLRGSCLRSPLDRRLLRSLVVHITRLA